MSETFLIKKTAFDDSGDYANRIANSIIIGQGELNGPGGTTRDSDLKLFGYGAPNWGEGHDQNILRILENNACPAKELNDYNPATGDYDYDPGTDPLLPKDENDLGFGNGITNPLIGQNWYNTANGLMYTYTITSEWSSAGEGATFLGDVDMAFNHIKNLGNPVDDFDAISKSYANSTYVNESGDTMTGTLNMSGNVIASIGAPLSSTDAINTVYADSRYMQFNGGVMTGDIQFEIPTSPNLQETQGLRWSGNSDLARIFVEGYAGTQDSRLVFYLGDEGASGDYMSFMLKDSGITTEVLELRSNSIKINVDVNLNNNDITNGGTLNSLNISTTDLSVSNNATISNWLYLNNPTEARIEGTDGMIIQYDTNGTSRNMNFYLKGVLALAMQGDSTVGPTQIVANTTINGNNKRIRGFAYPIANDELTSKLYVDTAIWTKIVVGTGTVAHGAYMTIPAGFLASQCYFVVGAGYWANFGGQGGQDGIDTFNCQHGPNLSQVTAVTTNSGIGYGGSGNYMIICRK